MAEKNADDVGGMAVGCLAVLFMAPFLSVWKAFVLVCLWGWFVTPFGVPQVGMAHAYGLMTLLMLTTIKVSPSDTDEESGFSMVSRTLAFGVVLPATALLCGWVAHLLMGAGIGS